MNRRDFGSAHSSFKDFVSYNPSKYFVNARSMANLPATGPPKWINQNVNIRFSFINQRCKLMSRVNKNTRYVRKTQRRNFKATSSSAESPWETENYSNYSIPSMNWRSKNQDYSPGWGTPVFYPKDDLSSGMNGGSRSENCGTTSEVSAKVNGGSHSKIFRPRRIILVRHGQSEGNVDEVFYTKTPDSKIALTRKGWNQAVKCGERIKNLIVSDGDENWKVYFYVSPYMRTLQTCRGIGLNFGRHQIAGVREEPRLREQDFGNFQDREKMRVEKAIRLRYGRFFYRFPDGESAADVYDRVTGFRETLRADIDIGRFQRPESSTCNMNLVLVSHGLTLRVFLMRWYKWTVEQFEGLYNFSNSGMVVMQLGQGGRYTLALHHSDDELRAFGLTEEMIADQKWQITSKPGDLNCSWPTSGPRFFDHYDHLENGKLDEYIPSGLSNASDDHSHLILP